MSGMSWNLEHTDMKEALYEAYEELHEYKEGIEVPEHIREEMDDMREEIQKLKENLKSMKTLMIKENEYTKKIEEELAQIKKN